MNNYHLNILIFPSLKSIVENQFRIIPPEGISSKKESNKTQEGVTKQRIEHAMQQRVETLTWTRCHDYIYIIVFSKANANARGTS
jgi:hypothetical protein